ncbi:MAG: helix-turn-helix domain-containing protein [Candidatus Aenigmarchaeota archaeon]|nr:helix-turn-helix domain-containing protein [Candidatus Aenigmarchaeota archaeon]
MVIKTGREVDYDTANTMRILKALESYPRGATINDLAEELNLNRHTVTKILDRLLIEKRVNYEERGPAKVFWSVGSSRFVGRIDQGKWDTLWLNVFKPLYPGEEEFLRINQTKHDFLIRASSKFRSVGAVAIKRSNLINLIRILRDVARKEFNLQI